MIKYVAVSDHLTGDDVASYFFSELSDEAAKTRAQNWVYEVQKAGGTLFRRNGKDFKQWQILAKIPFDDECFDCGEPISKPGHVVDGKLTC